MAILGHSDETETLRTHSHLWPDSDIRTQRLSTPCSPLLRTPCGPGTNNTRSDLHVYPTAV